MTQEQIEAKALAESLAALARADYLLNSARGEILQEEVKAAFIKGCQYAATPSAVSGLQWVKASERLPAIKDFDYEVVTIIKGHRSVWTIYCEIEATKLACLFEHSEVDNWLDESSPAQPGFSEQRDREAIRLARKTTLRGSLLKYTPAEIISLLNQKK